MATLHNRVSRKLLKEKAMADTTPRVTLSFYCYFHISDPQVFRDEWYKKLNAIKVYGRIYIANEGINAQINCPSHHFDNCYSFFCS